MPEPRPRRRYTKRQKVAAVTAALASSAKAAAEETGVPESTLRYWLDQPEYAELRAKTREDLAEQARVAAHLAMAQIVKRIGEFEPRDLVVAIGVLTDKMQLLSGQATSRSEHRDLTDDLDDHEREQLRHAIDEWLHQEQPA